MTVLLFIIWCLFCLMLADLLTGFGHWAEDTYGHLGMPEILRALVIRDNLIHHHKPATILNGSYWERNYISIMLAMVLTGVALLFRMHDWRVFLVLALGSQSNQVHMWGHMVRPPWPVKALQRVGLLQSPRHHSMHHRSPYACRFCTYTSILNPVLDRVKFWRGLEAGIGWIGLQTRRGSAEREGV